MPGIEHQRRGCLQVLEVLTAAEVVPAANLVGPDPDLERQKVHRSFDGIAGLGPACAAVGVGGRQVGEVSIAGEAKRRYVVDTRVQEAAEKWHPGRNEHHVRAHVGVEMNSNSEDLAGVVSSNFNRLQLAPALVSRERSLGPSLGPADCSAKMPRQGDSEKLVRIDVELRSEPTAYGRGDDPQLVLGDAGRRCNHHLQDVRHLRRGVERDIATMGRRHRQHATWLHRCGNEALLNELTFHGVRGAGKRSIDRRWIRLESPVIGQVRLEVRVSQRVTVASRCDRGDRRQHLVVDFDQLGGIAGPIATVGQDDSDDLSDVVNLFDSGRVVRWIDHVRGHGPSTRKGRSPQAHALQFGAAVDSMDTFGRGCGAGVDGLDPGMCVRATNHAHPQLAWHLDVVDVLAFAREELRIFLAQHRRADDIAAGLGGGHFAPPAQDMTDFTMLW